MVALTFAMLASLLAVDVAIADAQIDDDWFNPQIHIEIDMFVIGEAYYHDTGETYDADFDGLMSVGDGRGFNESGSSYFSVKLAVDENTGDVTVLSTSHTRGGLVHSSDVDFADDCIGYSCYTVDEDAFIEYPSPYLMASLFRPNIESRSIGDQWEITIETGHLLNDEPLSQRFRFTFPKEQSLFSFSPRPVEVDARYQNGLNLSIDFEGTPLVRRVGGLSWYEWLSGHSFSTDWSDPNKYIDEDAAPDGNGYVPPSGGGGIFNGPGGNSDGGSHGHNNGGWEPGTLADGSWFLDDGSMANYPLEDEVYVPSETIPLECELSDGAIENLDVPIGHVKTARDLIHICEFVEGVDYVIGG